MAEGNKDLQERRKQDLKNTNFLKIYKSAVYKELYKRKCNNLLHITREIYKRKLLSVEELNELLKTKV